MPANDGPRQELWIEVPATSSAEVSVEEYHQGQHQGEPS